VQSLITEVFGNGRRQPGAVQAHQWRMIRRSCNDDRTRSILGSEDSLDEFLHFTAALADQTNNDHVCAGVASHHTEQHALTDTAAGEEANTLAAPDGQQRVDGPDTHIEWL